MVPVITTSHKTGGYLVRPNERGRLEVEEFFLAHIFFGEFGRNLDEKKAHSGGS